ncbi:hypothetical protein ScPMuIL_011143 [Solemya velum]
MTTRGVQDVPLTKGAFQSRPPPYEEPPEWVPHFERANHPDYNNDVYNFLPRTVTLQRSKATDQLGFNIRGGKEHNCGIYVSKVLPNSEADRIGLMEADQILTVNGIDFQRIDHAEAVKVLKMNTSITMVLKFFPYGYDRTYDKSRYQNMASSSSLPSPAGNW